MSSGSVRHQGGAASAARRAGSGSHAYASTAAIAERTTAAQIGAV